MTQLDRIDRIAKKGRAGLDPENSLINDFSPVHKILS